MHFHYRPIKNSLRGLGLSMSGVLLLSASVFAAGASQPSPAPAQNKTSCPAGQDLYGGACVKVTGIDANVPKVNATPGGIYCPAGKHARSPGTNQNAEYAAYFGHYTCIPNADTPST